MSMGSKCDFPSELGLSVLFVVVNTIINIELYGIHLVKVKPMRDLSIFFLLDHMYHMLAPFFSENVETQNIKNMFQKPC